MKQSLGDLLAETMNAEEVFASSARVSSKATRTVATIEQGLTRLRGEVYGRIWAGETTGDKINDIVIVTKGMLNKNAADNLRALMARLAKYEGEFVAGRHCTDAHFDRILVGIISGSEPLLRLKPMGRYAKPYIELPIEPAVSYDSGWPWAFKNLSKSERRISIDKEEVLKRQRCLELEKLTKVDTSYPSIYIGDKAVWEFVLKTGQHKFGPIVTFAHIASALDRPLSTIPALKERVGPFVTEVQSLVPSFVKARATLAEIKAQFESARAHPFVKDVVEETERGLHDVTESLEAMETFLKRVEPPHQIKKGKHS